MIHWQEHVLRQPTHVILVQETHIGDLKEAQDMERLWCGVWGRLPDPLHPLSYWSVGILLHPFWAKDFDRVTHPLATDRVLMVAS